MTDRELLEAAAKSAGLRVNFHPTASYNWNPLTDDGDALRLAVKLNMHISVFVDAIGIGTPGDGYVEFKYEIDPYAATRRAIVSAAAAIGKEMK